MTTFIDLDVRPILRTGGEPFEKIMAAVAALEPGQGLRLFATFKPTPLLHVLGSKGFTHTAKELDYGEWEIVFSPSRIAEAMGARPGPPAADTPEWPAAIRHLDNRDLDPPEPMVRILATTETMAPGEVLSALLCREPTFLLPELAERGHDWRGGFEADGTYKILVRIGSAGKAAA
jgi:uncharacterized protein (DUF2249 family)